MYSIIIIPIVNNTKEWRASPIALVMNKITGSSIDICVVE